MKTLIESYTTKYEDLKKEKEAEERRKFPLELRLKEKIIGQEAAIATVASGIHKIARLYPNGRLLPNI